MKRITSHLKLPSSSRDIMPQYQYQQYLFLSQNNFGFSKLMNLGMARCHVQCHAGSSPSISQDDITHSIQTELPSASHHTATASFLLASNRSCTRSRNMHAYESLHHQDAWNNAAWKTTSSRLSQLRAPWLGLGFRLHAENGDPIA